MRLFIIVFCLQILPIFQTNLAAQGSTRNKISLGSVSKDNRFISELPLDFEGTYNKCKAARRSISAGRVSAAHSILAEPGIDTEIAKLFDFFAFAYVIFLEQRSKGENLSPFAISRTVSASEYSKIVSDVNEILTAIGRKPFESLSEFSSLAQMLSLQDDERALKILCRAYFFDAPNVPISDDSTYIGPAGFISFDVWRSLWAVRPDLYKSIPKPDYTMRNKIYADEVRKWLLANREQTMPKEFPKLANVQEAAFIAYLGINPKPSNQAEAESQETESANRFIKWSLMAVIMAVIVALVIRKEKRRKVP